MNPPGEAVASVGEGGPASAIDSLHSRSSRAFGLRPLHCRL